MCIEIKIANNLLLCYQQHNIAYRREPLKKAQVYHHFEFLKYWNFFYR